MARVSLELLGAAALLLVSALIVSAQKTPNAKQMQELQSAMDAVQKATNLDDEHKTKNKLIELVDKYYEISGIGLWTEPQFDPKVEGEGVAKRVREKYVRVLIGRKAFFSPPPPPDDKGARGDKEKAADDKPPPPVPSIAWLASTKLHEVTGHGPQAYYGRWRYDHEDDKMHALNEIEAYDLELKHTKTLGLSEVEINELKKRRQAYYDQLNDANKKEVDKGNYRVAFLPPTDSSQGGLSGQVTLLVSKAVYADEIATVTVRGPRTLEGLVVTTEVDTQRSQSKTDRRGGAVLSFPESSASVKSVSTVKIRVFDPAGKEIAIAQTRLLPGVAPDVVDRPSIDGLPSDFRRGDLITIAGRSMGPECEMIIGNQVQETLAASVNEITTYCDTPQLGPQDAWVRNPYGESKSFECNVYSFEVSAPRTTINRGEELTATARYQSLRPGTEVRFTNNTPNVVTMDVPGAKTMGNAAVFTVTNANGTIPINLKGLGRGAFSISYEVRPPQKR
ncbi:MAG: hypothetical protein ACT4OT_06415 [Acidobacteriota bacterium]